MLMNLGIMNLIAMAAPAAGGAAGQTGSWMSTLLPLVVIFAIFYFLMIRPQQKQQKKLRAMLGALKKGDEVVTRGGMLAKVFGIVENVVTLEIADGVKVKVTREAIAGLQNACDTDKKGASCCS
jgi:preprotein translocase subunit YajC